MLQETAGVLGGAAASCSSVETYIPQSVSAVRIRAATHTRVRSLLSMEREAGNKGCSGTVRGGGT